MNQRLRDNQQLLALVAGAVVFGLGLYFAAIPPGLLAPGLLLLLIGGVLVVLGLFGERDVEAGAGPFKAKISKPFAERAQAKVVEAAATEAVAGGHAPLHGELSFKGDLTAKRIEGKGELHALGAKLDGEGGVTGDQTVISPDPVQLELRTFAPEVSVEALAEASTPEELADRAVDFVRATAVPEHSAVVAYLARLSPEERAALLAEAEGQGEGSPG